MLRVQYYFCNVQYLWWSEIRTICCLSTFKSNSNSIAFTQMEKLTKMSITHGNINSIDTYDTIEPQPIDRTFNFSKCIMHTACIQSFADCYVWMWMLMLFCILFWIEKKKHSWNMEKKNTKQFQLWINKKGKTLIYKQFMHRVLKIQLN